MSDQTLPTVEYSANKPPRDTRRVVISVMLLFLAGGLAGYLAFGRPTLQQRAMAAYRAGRYAEALPLFKQWAAMPEVRNSTDQRNLVLAYILDMQNKLQPQAAANGGGGASTNPAAQSGSDNPSDLMAQAMAFAMAQRKNPSDPPTGADRIPHVPVKPGEVRALSIKEMGNFEYDQQVGGDLPADVKALDGGHVRLTGYMLPQVDTEKITAFALVPSLVNCCFGMPPGVQHVITCRTPSNKGADFSLDEIVIEGVVHVKVVREEGYTNSIFTVDVESVKAKG